MSISPLIRPVFDVQRGETYRLVYKITGDLDGLITGNETVRMVAKKIAKPQDRIPADDVVADFSLTPEFAAAAGSEPDRWYFTLSAADSLAAENGYYVTDARIVLDGGEVHKTDPVVLHLEQFVTGAA